MPTPASDPNESSRMKKIMSSDTDDSIRARLPHRDDRDYVEVAETVPPPPPAPAYVPAAGEPPPARRRWQFLPAFWTIASILSLTINVILIIILLLAWQMLGQIQGLQTYGTSRATGLLEGLYTNFVKMDQANITTDILVKDEIPVEFTLDVSGPTTVTTTQPVTIRGATVDVSTGGLTIRDANATIILPAGVVLPINISNLVVPVDKDVPVELNVPVDIPLDQTELHEPFVGLQKVVEPWYCFIQPNAMMDGRPVCGQTRATGTDPTLLDPALRTPEPLETVIP
jgi:hypothetical protein